jgi:hypothetical protein
LFSYLCVFVCARACSTSITNPIPLSKRRGGLPSTPPPRWRRHRVCHRTRVRRQRARLLSRCLLERNVFIMMARMDSHSVTTRSQHAHMQHAHLDTQPSAARVRQDRGPPGRLHLVQQGRRQLLHDLAQPAHPPCVPVPHLALFCVHLATNTLILQTILHLLLIRMFPNVPSKRPLPSPITLHPLPRAACLILTCSSTTVALAHPLAAALAGCVSSLVRIWLHTPMDAPSSTFAPAPHAMA